jgi:hypothetical protein
MIKNYCFLLIFLLLNVCGGADDKAVALLTRKWQFEFDRESYLQNMSEEERKVFGKVTAKQKEIILKQLEEQFEQNNLIEFKKDFTFEQILQEGEIKKGGNWELEADGKLLRLRWQQPNKKERMSEEQTIQELTAQRLVISYQDTKTGKAKTRIMIPSK